MKVFFYSLFILFLYNNSLVSQNLYYTIEEVQETGTVISNVSELIAGLKSDANLYLLPGTYTINSTINLRNIYNLNIVGADGVLIKGNLVNLINLKKKHKI